MIDLVASIQTLNADTALLEGYLLQVSIRKILGRRRGGFLEL